MVDSSVKLIFEKFKVGRLSSQVIQTGFGMVLFQGLNFITSVFLARQLGPVGQGRYQLLISIVVFVTMFTKLGLGEGLSYLLPKYRQNQPEKIFSLIAYVLFFTTLVSFVVSLLLVWQADYLAARFFGMSGFSNDLSWTPILIPITNLVMMGVAALRGLGRTDLRAYVYYLLVGSSTLVFLVFFSSRGLSLAEAFAARSLAFGLSGLATMILIAILSKSAWQMPSWSDLKQLHSFSSLLIFSGIFLYLVEQPMVDLILVGRFESDATVGIYSVASRSTIAVVLVFNAFVIVVGPAMANFAAQKNFRDLFLLYKKVSNRMALITLLLGGGVLVFRREFLGLFGVEYQSGETYLVILLVGYMIVGFAGMNSPVLLATGHSNLEFSFTGIAFLLMLLLGVIFGYYWGANGVALATSSAVIFLSLARRWAISRYFDMKYFTHNGTYEYFFRK